MPQPAILVNGVSYNWGSIVILLGTNILYGITELNFKKQQDKSNNMGVGNEPVSRGYGNNKYDASISMYMEDIKRLIAASPDGSLTGLPPFTVKAVYGNPAAPTVDELYNFEFMEDGNKMSQGDTKFIQNIPCIYAGQKR